MTAASFPSSRLASVVGLVLAVAWLAQGTVVLFSSVVGMSHLFGSWGRVMEGADSVLGALGMAGLLLGLKLADGALRVLGAVGVLRRWRWSLWLGILLSVLSLLSFPVGTIEGLATLVAFVYLWSSGYFADVRPHGEVAGVA